ncbi:DNA adenine methylase [uncultured Microbulbifer sp.]|uniref:DNA adenine methylase n=1 Tax=uncultured Microbulbifer sp. TaxID=348147 RepID=UPI002609C95B|nr:DNA adenine methylase [uncultured Microbulbifer sp.]
MCYLGSKAASGAYQAIIASMPPHDTYIETHLGSGAIMLRKPKAARSIGIDLDGSVIKGFSGGEAFELYNMDAGEYLNSFDYSTAGRVLIYADPPYIHSTRTSRKRYNHEYSDDDHRRLLLLLLRLSQSGVAVMISGYPSSLYDDLLPDWRTSEFQVMTRGGPRTEKLWFSFDSDSSSWATYAGLNYTDRQRIKRKAKRWASNYEKLPASERLAILSALLECECD